MEKLHIKVPKTGGGTKGSDLGVPPSVKISDNQGFTTLVHQCCKFYNRYSFHLSIFISKEPQIAWAQFSGVCLKCSFVNRTLK